MKFNYSVVKFVPDSFRGEYVNVGVIAGSDDTGEWEVRQVRNPARARRLDGGARLGAVFSYMDSVASYFEAAAEDQGVSETMEAPSRDWLEAESIRLRNVVQLSPPSPTVAESVDDALSRLMDAFTIDSERATRASRSIAIAALRSAFHAVNIPDANLHENVRATVGKQHVAIDFAIANGSLAQLAHAWNFEVASPEATVEKVKAWLLTIRDLKESGGTVASRPRPRQGKGDPAVQYEVPAGVDVEVVYVPPKAGESQEALELALDAFERSEVPAYSSLSASKVAVAAATALH